MTEQLFMQAYQEQFTFILQEQTIQVGHSECILVQIIQIMREQMFLWKVHHRCF